MAIGPHIVFIPGDVSIDVLEALRKALAKLPRVKNPVAGREYLDRARDKLDAVKPVLRQTLSAPIGPFRKTAVYRKLIDLEDSRQKAKRVRRELIDVGVTPYGMVKSESRYLPKILHDNEHIEAVVYGQHHNSSAMLVATDERIIYLDKKPMAAYFDEVSYEVVSGIEFDIHLFFATLVLHTPVKNYDIRFANLRCAEKFARHIETQRLEIEEAEKKRRPKIAEPVEVEIPEEAPVYPNELDENMAGYYWLPTEEEERRKIQENLV